MIRVLRPELLGGFGGFLLGAAALLAHQSAAGTPPPPPARTDILALTGAAPSPGATRAHAG